MYQHCLQETNPRARRPSEREDFLSPSLRSKFDKTPIDQGNNRQRRDSERVTSKKKTERISPAKTPQLAAKSSRKQLFTPESQAQHQEHHEKSEKRRKKKSSSAEPSTPSRHHSSSIIPDGFIPQAWQHFKFDQELLLSLAFNQG